MLAEKFLCPSTDNPILIIFVLIYHLYYVRNISRCNHQVNAVTCICSFHINKIKIRIILLFPALRHFRLIIPRSEIVHHHAIGIVRGLLLLRCLGFHCLCSTGFHCFALNICGCASCISCFRLITAAGQKPRSQYCCQK